MDILYEQQMIQAIIKIDKMMIKQWYKEILVVDNNTLVNIYGVRNKFKEFGRINDNLMFGQCLFLTISYLQDLHRNKKLFHGDIKPMNIFYEVKTTYITSDSGSLIPLYDSQEEFQAKVFTEGYASKRFIR
jgi:serine/threonine protein kinase